MQHVTFDTAKRLKEAGFPQPSPQAGQFLYGVNSKELFVILQYSEIDDILTLAGVGHHARLLEKWSWAKGAFVFAPTATDILQELPADLFLRFRQDYGDGIKYFYLESIAGGIHAGGPIAAEVCAVEYLRIRLAGIPILKAQ